MSVSEDAKGKSPATVNGAAVWHTLMTLTFNQINQNKTSANKQRMQSREECD